MKKGRSIVPQIMDKMDWFYIVLLASCLVSGEANPEPASSARASIPPVMLSPAAAEVVKDANESYIVSCQSERGIHIMWTSYNGSHSQQITQGKGRIHVENRRNGGGVNLIFESIERRDRGDYTCSASIDGMEVKQSFRLVVIKPITFVDTPTVQVAKEYTTVLVRCEVDGDPEPKIVWVVRGQTAKAPKYKTLEDGLLIENVTLEDRGEYLCRAYQASSVAGNMKEHTITLKIQHKPTWKSAYRGNGYEEGGDHGNNVNGEGSTSQAWGYIGGTVNLTCEAIAEPEATFHWLRDNETIMPDDDAEVINLKHRSVLQLTVRDESAFGDYVCKASNSLGTLERVVVLQKGAKPGAPTASIKSASADSILLEIRPPWSSSHHHHNSEHEQHHELPIIGYKIQWKRQEEQNWDQANTQDFPKAGAQYLISGLSHDTSYLIRVAAKNIAGVGDYAKDLHHRTGKITADSVTGESTSSALSIHVPPNSIFQLLLQVILLAIPYVSCRASLSVSP